MVEYEDGKISQVRIDPFGRASGSTVRKLFRMLHERLRRVSSKVSDESIRYHRLSPSRSFSITSSSVMSALSYTSQPWGA